MQGHVSNYPYLSKSKLIPLCRTCWVERNNSLEVTLDIMKAVTEALIRMLTRVRIGIIVLKDSLYLKALILNSVVAQRVLAFTSGVTTVWQTKSNDLTKLMFLSSN